MDQHLVLELLKFLICLFSDFKVICLMPLVWLACLVDGFYAGFRVGFVAIAVLSCLLWFCVGLRVFGFCVRLLLVLFSYI